MIDIHTHVLPGVDDGAQTLAESIGILRKAAEEGVELMVATPHVLEMPSQSAWQYVRETFDGVTEKLIAERIHIEVRLGAELFISPEVPSMVKSNRELTIDGKSTHVLLELPLQEIPVFTEQVVFKLLIDGITPIIVHPERCLEIVTSPGRVASLVQKGALTQINTGSLMGRYGKDVQKTAKLLLSRNLVHLMASDIHALYKNSYSLPYGMRLAARIVGRKKAEELVTTAPARIMNSCSKNKS